MVVIIIKGKQNIRKRGVLDEFILLSLLVIDNFVQTSNALRRQKQTKNNNNNKNNNKPKKKQKKQKQKTNKPKNQRYRQGQDSYWNWI